MNGVLNFCHFNAQSFNAHFDLINNTLSGVPLHIIGVSETWFSDSNVPRHLSGYKLFHKDRRNDRRFRGGGVALFVSGHINTGKIIKSPDNSQTDFVFVELINCDGTKMLVGVVYNPPAINWESNIKSAFENIAGNFLDVLILGDFNLDFLRQTNETINLKDFLFSLDLDNILRRLWPITRYMTVDMRKKLVISLIVPKFLYASPVYSGTSEGAWDKLRMAFNSCARYVFQKRKYDHISHLAIKILGTDIKSYLRMYDSIQLFKLIKSKSPQYLYRKLSFSRSTRTQNLNIPENTVWARSNSLFVRGVGRWNALSLSIRCQGSVENFKRCYWEGLSHL
jgi:hypothetical protein